MFETPILFIVFNRPDNTQCVFDKIRHIQPRRLYIVADGPRKTVEADHMNCYITREIVKKIDWDCEVKTDFKNENVGPEVSIKNALNWFFSEVEYGIILEDDCVPNKSFFIYCEMLLKKFQHDDTINIISGSNLLDEKISEKYNYFISDLGYTWGWASWARVFRNFTWGKQYDLEKIKQQLYYAYKNKKYTDWLFNIIKHSYEAEVNWDVELLVNNIMNNKKNILPNVNLISNIGNTGTHYNNSEDRLLNTKTFEIDFEKFDVKNFTLLSSKELQKVIKQFNDKTNYLTLRDKFYLFRKRLNLS